MLHKAFIITISNNIFRWNQIFNAKSKNLLLRNFVKFYYLIQIANQNAFTSDSMK